MTARAAFRQAPRTGKDQIMSRWNYLLISLAMAVADQATKAMVVARFSDDSSVSIIPGFFRLVSVAAIVLVGVLLWQNQPAAIRTGAGLALILGGAAGNLLDRLARGHVVDFLDFYVGSYHWPAFNIADSAISIGAATLLWDLLVAQPARHRAA